MSLKAKEGGRALLKSTESCKKRESPSNLCWKLEKGAPLVPAKSRWEGESPSNLRWKLHKGGRALLLWADNSLQMPGPPILGSSNWASAQSEQKKIVRQPQTVKQKQRRWNITAGEFSLGLQRETLRCQQVCKSVGDTLSLVIAKQPSSHHFWLLSKQPGWTFCFEKS